MCLRNRGTICPENCQFQIVGMFDTQRTAFLDMSARLFEKSGTSLDRRHNRFGTLGESVVGKKRNPKITEDTRFGDRNRKSAKIICIGIGHQFHRKLHVFHMPRHRADVPERFEPEPCGWNVAGAGKTPTCRLYRSNSAKGSRYANTAQTIAAEPKRRTTR